MSKSNLPTKPRYRIPAGRGIPQLVALAPPKSSRPKRFKVQRRVEVSAHDENGKRFMLTETWRTVIQADRQATAERLLLKKKHDEPHRTWRIAEEWPFGSNLRALVTTKGTKPQG